MNIPPDLLEKMARLTAAKENVPKSINTIDDVKTTIECIKQMIDSPEDAHETEDWLYKQTLEAISESDFELASLLAREALKASELTFSRWFA